MAKLILIIDDDPVVRLLFEELVPSFGYAVQSYGTGAEGLTGCVASSSEIAAVFLDYMLPDTTGPEALVQIRQKLGHEIPVVLMSAHENTAELLKGVSFQPDAILAKPFTVAELRSLVHQIIEPE